MTRRIIQIDEEKCIGCEACVSACQEGAIGMVDGKARLLREDHCDGLGNCLPNCPADAISFIEKEISPSGCNTQDKKTEFNKQGEELPCGCPGNQSKQIKREVAPSNVLETVGVQSQLTQWPVQIKLAPINAPYFNNANLLIAADCTAYAYADFHNKFIKNKVCLIGCPKLDEGDYADKLTAIIKNNDIKSVTVARMEVPCCGGIESAVKRALQASGKFIPWQIVTISTDGKILD
ncbi:MAG: ATP-binding protein [Acutalibacteraceae bacterium]|mgnify:FL=1|jgi:Pyruvate/2-oxoacid:ferredoxin oxidoreductase delta subunit